MEGSINSKKILVILWLIIVAAFACASIIFVHKVMGVWFFTIMFGVTVIFHTAIYCNEYYWREIGYPKFKIESDEPVKCEVVDIVGVNHPVNLFQKTELFLKSLDDGKYYRLCLEDISCYNYLGRIRVFKCNGCRCRYYVPIDNYGTVIKAGDVVNVYVSSACDFVFRDRLWGKCSLFYPELDIDEYLNAKTLYGMVEFL